MWTVDPTDKAAECLRALELSADPYQRILLISLRALWIELAKAGPSFSSEADFADLLEKIGRIHNSLLGPVPNVH